MKKLVVQGNIESRIFRFDNLYPIGYNVYMKKTQKNKKAVKYDEAMIKHFSENPKELKEYLRTALEEYQKDSDEKAFLSALALAAKVKGGFKKLSKDTGLSRESLYKALSESRDPRFSTVVQVVSSLGYSIKIA